MRTAQKLLILLGNHAAAVTTLILDTFTGADGTLLAAHTPDINVPGGSWAIGDGSGMKIRSNQAVKAGIAVAYDRSRITAAANTTITVDVVFTFDLIGQEVIVSFRETDSSNYWWFELNSASNCNLYERVGGITQRGTAALSLSAGAHTVKIVLSGTAINCYVDDVLKITYSSISQVAAILVGLGNVSSPNTTFDNFKVTVP